MGYEKIVTLAERCAKYAQACGKRRIIETKSVKIIPKPELLGYICPDGTINFQSQQSAITYAKNRAISALNCSKPHERTIIVSKNQILDEFNGDKTTGGLYDSRKYRKLHNNISVYHGHPDINGKGVTTPISLKDYKILKQFGDNVDEIVAFNSIGEFSKLENIHQPTWLPKWLQIFRRLKQNSSCELSFKKQIFDSLAKQMNELLQKARLIMRSADRNFDEINKINEEINKLNKLAENTQISNEGINKIHTFWSNATKKHKYGIKYSTNFSHLDNIQ